MRNRLLASVAVCFAMGVASGAAAQDEAVNDPSVGGNLNKCWGQVRSQLNQLETPEGTKGGAGGQHSRSTRAANNNGGFSSDDNGFGITFNVGEDADGDGNIDPGSKGRTGVGNVSKGAPHSVHPGDGGNGQHAINNSNDSENGAGFSNVLDPVSGEFLPRDENGAPITNGDLRCDLP
jgi:hypothetical protein